LPLAVAGSSALGGALRAAQAIEGHPFDELFARFAAPDLARVTLPDRGARGAYADLGAAFEQRLSEALAEAFVKR
jgi:hypothetical protein